MATLGEHHRQYNKTLQHTIANAHKVDSIVLDSEADDIDNLLKIDIVSNNRDAEALLNIFKCEDMLYVSRAIKRSTWLITEPQYSHIINPEYLYTELQPHMMAKAFNKLLSHIRLSLKDERRVETFYKYEASQNANSALRWLPQCSVAFIEGVIKDNNNISYWLLSRLCEKSFTILQAYLGKKDNFGIAAAFENTMFLLTSHTEMYLDAIREHHESIYSNLHFGKKYTKLIMTKFPEKVMDNFEIYAEMLDMKTFVKYIHEENVQDFLLKYVKSEKLEEFFTFDKLKEFILRMPAKSRFNFVRQHFIDVANNKDEISSDASERASMVMYSSRAIKSTNVYDWYKFAPFEVAFGDLKKLIRAESSPSERRAMLAVLVACTGRNSSRIRTLLEYYHNKHINEPFMYKNDFVKLLIERTDTYAFDEASWNILNTLFRSMDVYNIESTNKVQACIRAIILYNVLHEENIPEVVENKFEFNTFKNIQKKLKQHEREALFRYLYTNSINKITNASLNDESGLKEVVKFIEDILKLLKDWNKELSDYPVVLQKIKELANKKRDKAWKVDLASIYNTKKSWRKLLFEESVVLCPSELVCINALKHDPGLLTRYKHEVEALCCNDDVSLQHLLAKIRVFWRSSLAEQWTNEYAARLKTPGGHKALTSGLFTLMVQKPLLKIFDKYAPKENKINWSEEDELSLSLRKHIALKMHIARPLIPLDAVLLYAKGDYLQYAVPSLNAVLYNVSSAKFRVNILKLLDAPVSLQKFGIRYASTKLGVAELKKLFEELWASSKNLTIRNVVFTLAYDLLCKEKDPSLANELASLICKLIDSLTFEENKDIYKKMSCIKAVPMHVQAQLYQKSYVFLESLPKKSDYENYLNLLLYYAPEIIDKLDPDFVSEMFLNEMIENFKTTKCKVIHILAAFILVTMDEAIQMKRYEEFLVPLLQLPLTSPELLRNKVFIVNFQNVLKTLTKNLEGYVVKNKVVIPTKLVANIQKKLEIILPAEKHYVELTCWKLLTAYVNLLDEHRHALESGTWEELITKIAPLLADKCVTYLKEDVEKYFPSIYLSFSQAVKNFFSRSDIGDNTQYTLFRHLLRVDSIQTYLLVLSLWPWYLPYDNASKAILAETQRMLFTHPSLEIKMHYYSKFSDAPELIVENLD